MKTLSLAVRNGLWNTLGTAATTAVGLFISIFVVRALDPAAYGQLSYFLWLAGLVTTIGILGVPQALTRFIADLRGRESPEHAVALSRWAMRGLVAVNLVAAAILFVAALRADPAIRSYLMIIAFLPVSNAWGRILASDFSGRERYRPTAVATMISSLVQLILVLLSQLRGWGPLGFFVALVSPHLITTVVLATLRGRAPRQSSPAPIDPRTVRRFLAFTLPVTLQLFVDAVVWQRSEVFFLERLSTVAEIGYYSLAFTLTSMLLGLGWALINGFYPAISKHHGAGESDAVRDKFTQALLLALIFAVPFTFGGIATIPELIRTVIGEEWLVVVPTARILFAGLIPGVVAGVFGLSVTAIGRPWALLPFSGAVTVLNVALDLLLIPGLGAVGAAVANVAAQTSFAVAAWLILHRLVGASAPVRSIAFMLTVGAITTLALPWLLLQLLPGALGLIVSIAVSGGAYVGAILLIAPRAPRIAGQIGDVARDALARRRA